VSKCGNLNLKQNHNILQQYCLNLQDMRSVPDGVWPVPGICCSETFPGTVTEREHARAVFVKVVDSPADKGNLDDVSPRCKRWDSSTVSLGKSDTIA
jgi:hypothetical protein